jgi:hypothetical protein
MNNIRPVAFALLAAVAIPCAAQNPFTQLGLSEVRARELATAAARGNLRSAAWVDDAARKAFVALPGSARATVTTALWVWAKTYLGSPAFKTEYARIRAEATPEAPRQAGTVDQALSDMLAEQLKSLEETRKMLPQLPADQRKQMETMLKEREARLKGEEYRKIMRMAVESERTTAKASYDRSMEQWRTDYPADANLLIARQIRAFLAECADVDFAARTQLVDNKKVFTNAAYERKSAAWKECYRAGPESVGAARAAANAWLTALGR